MNESKKYIKYFLLSIFIVSAIGLFVLSIPKEKVAYAGCGGTYHLSSGVRTCGTKFESNCLVINGAKGQMMSTTCNGGYGNCICAVSYLANYCLYRGILGCNTGRADVHEYVETVWGFDEPCIQWTCGQGGAPACACHNECDYGKTPPKCNKVCDEPSCILLTWQRLYCKQPWPKPTVLNFMVACQWLPDTEPTPGEKGGPGDPPEDPVDPVIVPVTPMGPFHWNARDVDVRLKTVVIQFTIEGYDPSYGTEAIVWITTPTGERYSSYMFPANRGVNGFELNGEVAQSIESTDNSMCPNHADRDCFGTTLGHLLWGGSKSSDAIGQWSATIAYQGAVSQTVYWTVYSDLPYEP